MKVLLLPFAPSLAHVSRCLALAELLRQSNHEPVFGLGAEKAGMVQRAGFEAHALPEVSGETFRQDVGFRFLSHQYLADNLDAESALLQRLRPELVVSDFRFTAPISARRAGVPCAGIVHGSALRLAQQPAEVAKLIVGQRRLMGVLFPWVFQKVMARVASRLHPFLDQAGMPRVRTPFALLPGDVTLIADVPGFVPDQRPARSAVIGPLQWSGWSQSQPELDLPRDRPVVYVTMGSTVEAAPLLMKILQALAGADFFVVVAAGPMRLPDDFRVPDNARLFATVPGDWVMRRSAIAIHHGGHGTLMQALAAGVPSLMIPHNPDQIVVSRQAEALGAGRTVSRGGLPFGGQAGEWLRPEEIRRLVELTAGDSAIRESCARQQAEISRLLACQLERVAACLPLTLSPRREGM